MNFLSHYHSVWKSPKISHIILSRKVRHFWRIFNTLLGSNSVRNSARGSYYSSWYLVWEEAIKMRGCWKWPGFSSILAFRRGSKEQKVEQRGREISLGVILVWGCWWRNFAFATTTPLLVCPKFCFSIIYMEVCQSLSKIDPEGSLVRCGFRIIRHLDKAHLKENFRFAFFWVKRKTGQRPNPEENNTECEKSQ